MRALAAAVLLLTSCSTLDVHTDHDPKADFSKYRSFGWATSSGQALDASGLPSQLVDRRVREAVEAQLTSKGLRKVAVNDQPDLLVRTQITQKERLESSSGVGLSAGYGSWPWFGGIASAPSQVRQRTEGIFVIDMIDRNTEVLVWRGIASDAIGSPEENAEEISNIVAETLEKYPPTKQG